MKWCCDGLKHMFDRRYDRTIYIYADPPASSSDRETFWIGMRSVNKGDINRMPLLNIPNDIPITINTRIPISFCPWCGSNLYRIYKNTYNQLVDESISKEFLVSLDNKDSSNQY